MALDANTVALLCSATAACASVACAIITSNNSKKATKREKFDADERKRIEARAEARAKESKLSMDMMMSTMDLAYVTSLAVTGGHINGNVEAAQTRAVKSKEKYDKFCREQAADSITI